MLFRLRPIKTVTKSPPSVLVSCTTRAPFARVRHIPYPISLTSLSIRGYQIGMGEMKQIMPDGFKVAGPYHPAVVAGGMVYCSGAIPVIPDTGKVIEGNIGDMTQRCCENLKAVLEHAGSSLEKVVKVNIFLADMGDFAEMNVTYEKYFGHRPARSCVAVKQLPLNVPVEIECIAMA